MCFIKHNIYEYKEYVKYDLYKQPAPPTHPLHWARHAPHLFLDKIRNINTQTARLLTTNTTCAGVTLPARIRIRQQKMQCNIKPIVAGGMPPHRTQYVYKGLSKTNSFARFCFVRIRIYRDAIGGVYLCLQTSTGYDGGTAQLNFAYFSISKSTSKQRVYNMHWMSANSQYLKNKLFFQQSVRNKI